MAFYPHQHFKREGAKQTAVCDWCGQWVNVQDLIPCDVQGFRGYYVCSSHPWEKDKRVKPSFLDRGGVGQVIDPGHDMLPAPGGGLFFDPVEDIVSSAFKSMNQTVGTTLTADTELSLSVVQGKTYWFRVVAATTTNPNDFRAAMNGTATASQFVLGAPNVTSGKSNALGTEVSAPGQYVKEFVGTITAGSTGSFGPYFRVASGTVTVEIGSFMVMGQIT